jgi:Spy/CpxP family protein refolding chaperone
LLATAGLLIATALPAAAQQNAPQRTPAPGGAGGAAGGMWHGGMRGPGGPGGPGMMMGRRGGSPAAMLAHMKTPLNLTDDQVKRLEALAVSQKAALEPNAGAMLRAQADLADARKGEGDLVATRKALEKLAALRVDGAMAHFKAMQEARAVLTAEQKEKLPAMRGAMMGRGGPGGPGMRGGMHGGMMGPDGHGMMRGRGPGAPGGTGPAGAGPDDEDDLDFAFEDPMEPTR